MNADEVSLRPRRIWPFVVPLFCLVLAAMLMHPALPAMVRSHLPPSINARAFGYFAHAASYALLTSLALLLIRPRSRGRIWLIAGVFALHGVLTEAAQYWIPTRDCDPFDLLANCFGIATAVALFRPRGEDASLPGAIGRNR